MGHAFAKKDNVHLFRPAGAANRKLEVSFCWWVWAVSTTAALGWHFLSFFKKNSGKGWSDVPVRPPLAVDSVVISMLYTVRVIVLPRRLVVCVGGLFNRSEGT